MKPFVHLHNHTQYSLFDGLTRIPEMVKKAKDLGMPAVAGSRQYVRTYSLV